MRFFLKLSKPPLEAAVTQFYLAERNSPPEQNAVNFTDEQLKEAVRLCHLRGVKVYQAINTVVFDEQLEECKKSRQVCRRNWR